jgi:hypothetical protein
MDKATQELAATAEELAAASSRFRVESVAPQASAKSLSSYDAFCEDGGDAAERLSEF